MEECLIEAMVAAAPRRSRPPRPAAEVLGASPKDREPGPAQCADPKGGAVSGNSYTLGVEGFGPQLFTFPTSIPDLATQIAASLGPEGLARGPNDRFERALRPPIND